MHPDSRVVPFPVIDPPANLVTANRWKQIAEDCSEQLELVQRQLDAGRALVQHMAKRHADLLAATYLLGLAMGGIGGFLLRGAF